MACAARRVALSAGAESLIQDRGARAVRQRDRAADGARLRPARGAAGARRADVRRGERRRRPRELQRLPWAVARPLQLHAPLVGTARRSAGLVALAALGLRRCRARRLPRTRHVAALRTLADGRSSCPRSSRPCRCASSWRCSPASASRWATCSRRGRAGNPSLELVAERMDRDVARAPRVSVVIAAYRPMRPWPPVSPRCAPRPIATSRRCSSTARRMTPSESTAEFPEVVFEQHPTRLLAQAARNRGVERAATSWFSPTPTAARIRLARARRRRLRCGHAVVSGSMGLRRRWFAWGVHLSKFSWLLRGAAAGSCRVVTANAAHAPRVRAHRTVRRRHLYRRRAAQLARARRRPDALVRAACGRRALASTLRRILARVLPPRP